MQASRFSHSTVKRKHAVRKRQSATLCPQQATRSRAERVQVLQNDRKEVTGRPGRFKGAAAAPADSLVLLPTSPDSDVASQGRRRSVRAGIAVVPVWACDLHGRTRSRRRLAFSRSFRSCRMHAREGSSCVAGDEAQREGHSGHSLDGAIRGQREECLTSVRRPFTFLSSKVD